MLALQQQMMRMHAGKIDPIRFGDTIGGGHQEGFNQALRDSGAFRVEQVKLKSATESYTESLQKQDVTFRNWRKNADLRNSTLREQYRIQKMMVMGWKEDGHGRMSADMIIPRDVPDNLGNMRTRLSELKGEANRFGTIMDEQRMKVGLWSQAVQSASHNVVNWGKNTQWAGRQMMVGLSIPLIALGAVTGKLAYDIDKEMTRILKVYDYATTQMAAEGARIREESMNTARFMAKEFGQAAEDTLAITGALAATGQTGRGLQQSTNIVGRAMFLGDLDREDALRTTIALQTVYRKEGESSIEMNRRLAESYDYLNSLENQTNLSMQDMTIAIPKLAGVVNSLGGGLQDIGTLMTAATAGGIKTAEAANALKTVLFRSVAPNNLAATSFFEKTGQDINELIERTKGEAIPTIMELGKAMQGMDNVEKAGFLKEFFGIYQGSKAGIVAKELLNIYDATTMVGRAFAVGNQSASVWAETRQKEIMALQESISGKFRIALETLKVELAEIGVPFLKAATKVIGIATKIASAFNGVSDRLKELTMWGMGLGALFGIGVMLIGVFANFTGTIMSMGATLLNASSRFKAVNADQQAAALLSKQSALAFRDQGTAAQVLANQLNKVNAALSLMATEGARKAAIAQLGTAGATAGTLHQIRKPVPMPGTIAPGTGGLAIVRDEATQKLRHATKSEITMGREIAHSEALVENSTRAAHSTNNLATASNKAAIGFGRVSGAALTTAGTVGMLVGGTNQWVVGLSAAAMLMGSMNIAGKGIAVQQAITGAWNKANLAYLLSSGLAAGRLEGKIAGSAAGAKAFGTALLAAITPIGAAAAVMATLLGGLWLVKKRSDEIVESYRRLRDVAKGAAEAMGINYAEGGRGADADIKERIDARGKIMEQYKEEINLIGQMGEEQARNEIKRIGIEFYQGTGDADMAQELMDMIAGGNQNLNVKINFEADTARQVLNGLQAQIDNFTDSDWGQTRAEEMGGNIDADHNWFGRKQKGISAKAIEDARSFGRMLGNEVQNSLSTGDSKGAEKLVRDAQRIVNESGRGLKEGTTAYKDHRIAIQYLQEAMAGALHINTETGRSAANLNEIYGKAPELVHANKNALTSANGAVDEFGNSAEDAAAGVAELSDAQQKLLDITKSAMGTAWGNVLDEVGRVVDENHEAAMDGLESAGQRRVDALEAQAEDQEKGFERRSKDMDKTQKDQDKTFKSNWDMRKKAVEDVYDSRVKKIEETMAAEDKAEEQRQKMFEAERTRIQRLADMYNQNVDFNVALNSGDLDEAARLTNNMRATEQQWGLEDNEGLAEDAHSVRQDAMQSEIDEINTAKDARLEALAIEEEAAKEALEARQEREKEALADEKARAQESAQARIAAEQAKTKAAVDSANKSYDARKRQLDLELEYLRAMTPRNEAEMKSYLARIEDAYGRHGIDLNTNSQQWANYVASAMHSASAATKAEMGNEADWAAIGSSIGDTVAQNMLGMTFTQFLEWMRTGVVPTQPSPTNNNVANFDQIERRAAESVAAAGRNQAAIDVRRQGSGRLIQHGGGPAGKGSGRGGRPMTAGLYGDEIPTILQKGEYVVQKRYATEAGPILEAINNGSFFHQGGMVGGIGGMFEAMIRNGLATGMAMGAQRKVAEGAQVPGGVFQKMIGSPIDPRPAAPIVGPGFVLGKEAMQAEGLAGTATGFVSGSGNYPARQFRRAAGNTMAAKAFLAQTFPSTRGGGDLSLARQDAGSDHAWGKALDIFPGTAFGKYASPMQVAHGNQVMSALQNNAGKFGLKYLIWQKKINSGNGWKDYTRYGPNPGPTLGHYDHIHASFRHGGGPVGMDIPGLKTGGTVKYDNTIANLHKNERVLTAPSSKAFEKGIQNLDQAGNVTYDIKMDFTGAVIRDNVDIEKAINKVLKSHEDKMGRKRTIG